MCKAYFIVKIKFSFSGHTFVIVTGSKSDKLPHKHIHKKFSSCSVSFSFLYYSLIRFDSKGNTIELNVTSLRFSIARKQTKRKFIIVIFQRVEEGLYYYRKNKFTHYLILSHS